MDLLIYLPASAKGPVASFPEHEFFANNLAVTDPNIRDREAVGSGNQRQQVLLQPTQPPGPGTAGSPPLTVRQRLPDRAVPRSGNRIRRLSIKTISLRTLSTARAWASRRFT